MIVQTAPRPAGSPQPRERMTLRRLITEWVLGGLPRRIA